MAGKPRGRHGGESSLAGSWPLRRYVRGGQGPSLRLLALFLSAVIIAVAPLREVNARGARTTGRWWLSASALKSASDRHAERPLLSTSTMRASCITVAMMSTLGQAAALRASALGRAAQLAARRAPLSAARRRARSTMSEDAADTPAPVDASAAVNSEFLRVMQSRGYLYQCSNLAELDALMCKEIVPAYLGFDATASSLHVGSLLQIMILRHLQRCGHKPVVLVGGGTTKIGDPSGRDTTRQMLTDEQIDANIAGISKVAAAASRRAALMRGRPRPERVDACRTRARTWLARLVAREHFARRRAHPVARPRFAGLRALSHVWRRPDRRGACEQRRVAGAAAAATLLARLRAVLYDQPDAHLRVRQAAPWPRAAPHLSRV